MARCTHLDQVSVYAAPEEVEGPDRHASRHAAEAGHPVLRSVEPGEAWSWCAVDEVAFVLRAP